MSCFNQLYCKSWHFKHKSPALMQGFTVIYLLEVGDILTACRFWALSKT